MTTQTTQISAADQGRQAARDWLAAGDYVPQPENPVPRPATYDAWKAPSDFMRWNRGFDAECYREFGDMDADMSRAERLAGC